jgi:hypothetical protein
MSYVAKLMRIAGEECAKRGLDGASGSYFQCGRACGSILAAADALGIPGIDLMQAYATYPKDAGYAKRKGKPEGHYFLRVGTTYYDFALRQFAPGSPFPFVAEEDSEDVFEVYREPLENNHYDARGNAIEDLVNAIVDRFRTER